MRLVSPKSQRQGEKRLRKEGQRGKSTRHNPRDSRFMRVEHGIYLQHVVQGATRVMAHCTKTDRTKKSRLGSPTPSGESGGHTPFRRSLAGFSLFFFFFFLSLFLFFVAGGSWTVLCSPTRFFVSHWDTQEHQKTETVMTVGQDSKYQTKMKDGIQFSFKGTETSGELCLLVLESSLNPLTMTPDRVM